MITIIMILNYYNSTNNGDNDNDDDDDDNDSDNDNDTNDANTTSNTKDLTECRPPFSQSPNQGADAESSKHSRPTCPDSGL